MTVLLYSLLIGVVAGLRAMMPAAAISWAAWLGWLNLDGTWLSFMGHWIAVAIFTILAIVELITDQLPSTPSRKVPQQFGARIVLGGLSGLALALPSGAWIGGLIAGVVGAIVGTLGGAEARKRFAEAFGQDRPAAFIEDAVAIACAFLIVAAVQ
ncbi:DUF4126 family protein [Aquamicrobium sp. LC103]|uniref:DUF4126 family protein n=1 Tax=Aquamicrobium sp. LC103 TaxID=1120658 RepID=UPI0010C9DAD4|nr:DUF4126 family protein [Aquamicrobium sp. LC103]TKT75070.1 DUF4126 family protein [Aquamicrobium sp. LC103]